MSKTLRLNSLKTTRNTLARLSREFYLNENPQLEKDNTWFRTLTTLLKYVLEAHKIEKGFELEHRIEAIEKILRGRGDRL